MRDVDAEIKVDLDIKVVWYGFAYFCSSIYLLGNRSLNHVWGPDNNCIIQITAFDNIILAIWLQCQLKLNVRTVLEFMVR